MEEPLQLQFGRQRYEGDYADEYPVPRYEYELDYADEYYYPSAPYECCYPSATYEYDEYDYDPGDGYDYYHEPPARFRTRRRRRRPDGAFVRAAWVPREVTPASVPGAAEFHYQPGNYSFGTEYVLARREPSPPPPPRRVVTPEPEYEVPIRRLQPPPRIYEEVYDPVPRVPPQPLAQGRKYLRPPKPKYTHKRPFVVRRADCASCTHCGAKMGWGEPPPLRACDRAIDVHCTCMANCMRSSGF